MWVFDWEHGGCFAFVLGVGFLGCFLLNGGLGGDESGRM